MLDVGCGRGLLLIGAVQRNAAAERVVVEVVEGDARCLPFSDVTFDVVVSNFVVHEINISGEREQMMNEMVRVLRPGGRLALVDFIFTRECVAILRILGIGDAGRTRLVGWSAVAARVLMFGTFQIHLVTGRKGQE